MVLHQTKVIIGLVKPQAGVIQGDKQSNGNVTRERRKKVLGQTQCGVKKKSREKRMWRDNKGRVKAWKLLSRENVFFFSPGAKKQQLWMMREHTHTCSNRGNRGELQLRGGKWQLRGKQRGEERWRWQRRQYKNGEWGRQDVTGEQWMQQQQRKSAIIKDRWWKERNRGGEDTAGSKWSLWQGRMTKIQMMSWAGKVVGEPGELMEK